MVRHGLSGSGIARRTTSSTARRAGDSLSSRQAIADSFSIRRSALQQKVTYSTTMTGAMALVDSLASRGQGEVHSLQELHARLDAAGSGGKP